MKPGITSAVEGNAEEKVASPWLGRRAALSVRLVPAMHGDANLEHARNPGRGQSKSKGLACSRGSKKPVYPGPHVCAEVAGVQKGQIVGQAPSGQLYIPTSPRIPPGGDR